MRNSAGVTYTSEQLTQLDSVGEFMRKFALLQGRRIDLQLELQRARADEHKAAQELDQALGDVLAAGLLVIPDPANSTASPDGEGPSSPSIHTSPRPPSFLLGPGGRTALPPAAGPSSTPEPSFLSDPVRLSTGGVTSAAEEVSETR